MGERGPAPTPTALRVLHGDRPSRINANEPMPAEGTPKMPPLVRRRPVARAYWRRLVTVLKPMRVMTLADADAMARYCMAMADVDRYDAMIAAAELDASVLRSEDESRIQRMKYRAAEHSNRIAAKFGLTAADRVSLVAGPPADGGGLEALLT